MRRAGPHHREALVNSVYRVTGLETEIDSIPVQGMLDPVIIQTMMRAAGAPVAMIRRTMPAIIEEAQRIYARTCPRDLSSKVCPAARSTLAKLNRRGIPAGLVTGNLSRIAWRKVTSAGLAQYLRFGAFSEAAADRAGLVRIALNHARRRGWLNGRTRVWLVGDHQNDILAARANSVGSIAVATGLSPRGELAEYAPDILVDDLKSLPWDVVVAS